ncbi:MAG: hypothetical protein QGI46_04530, partial [Planctomycetota bacterium]|nr:hypothetical protein [Planctomycetota bacterium]
MTQFKYAAKGPGGKTVEGTIDAGDRKDAVAELRRQNLVVMRVDERGAGRTGVTTSLFQLRTRKAKPAATR